MQNDNIQNTIKRFSESVLVLVPQHTWALDKYSMWYKQRYQVRLHMLSYLPVDINKGKTRAVRLKSIENGSIRY